VRTILFREISVTVKKKTELVEGGRRKEDMVVIDIYITITTIF